MSTAITPLLATAARELLDHLEIRLSTGRQVTLRWDVCSKKLARLPRMTEGFFAFRPLTIELIGPCSMKISLSGRCGEWGLCFRLRSSHTISTAFYLVLLNMAQRTATFSPRLEEKLKKLRSK